LKYRFLYIVIVCVLLSCEPQPPRRPVLQKSHSFLDQTIALNKALLLQETALIKAYMEKDSLNEYSSSPHGFWYKYERKGAANYTPGSGDKVFYTYEVFSLENQVLYTQTDIGAQAYLVDKQDLLPGLANGLKLMHAGDKVSFLFPSHSLYASAGDQHKIARNQPLQITIQLNQILKKNESN